MKNAVDSVLRAREGGHTERCHGIPHFGSYPVSSHTFDMLVLVEFLHPAPTLALYRAVLRHDLHERYLGDIPGRVKSSHPDLYREWKNATERVVAALGDVELTGDERRWLDAVDKLELLLWCEDQLAMGNKNVTRVMGDVRDRLANSDLPQEISQFLGVFRWQRTNEMRPDE